MRTEGEVYVEKVVKWNIVMKRPFDSFGVKEWLCDSEQEAVERADRMFDTGLFTQRGEDKL